MNSNYQNLPSIEKLMSIKEVCSLTEQYGRNIVLYAARITIQQIRNKIEESNTGPQSLSEIISEIKSKIYSLSNSSFKQVINATGIILHTNLGRSPLSSDCINKIQSTNNGYSNLEIDLKTGTRTNRLVHLTEKLKFLTGAEDAIVVNNNAAAIILVLNTLAKNKEAIISRGELVEIGDSFRIHEIMETSDTIVKEVGSTNKTRIEDYQNALSENTGIIIKVHKSNYSIKGFTSEVSIRNLADFSKKNNIPFIYDQGSGLISKYQNLFFTNEPDVISILKSGADIVTFSGDKLMGGPQAGIIVGKAELINKLKKSPLIRALRIDKITISVLEYTLDYYIKNQKLPIFNMINITPDNLKTKADFLTAELLKKNIKSEIVKSLAKYGGGTLPDKNIKSFAVKLDTKKVSSKKLFHSLLNHQTPIIGILKTGSLFLDVLTIESENIPLIAKTISEIISSPN